MNRFWILAALLALVISACTACGGTNDEPTEETVDTIATEETTEEPEPETEPEVLPDLWPDYENAIVNPFTEHELQEAYDMAAAKLGENPDMGQLVRLCFDPILTHHDAVEAYIAKENEGWELERYFANRISMSFEYSTEDEAGIIQSRQGSIRLSRGNDRELWQAGEVIDLQCEQSALLRSGHEMAVVFDDCLCGYEQEDGSLMAYCHRAGTDRVALQTGKLPWGPKAKPSDSEFYFSTLHEYSDGDLNYEPGWLGGELTIHEGEDGMLGLYRNDELLWNYFDAGCEYRFTPDWLYYLEDNTLCRVDYAGRGKRELFSGEALSTTFYVAQDTVFLICQTDDQSAVYRLFAADLRCDLLSAQIPVPLDVVALDPPIANTEIVWSYMNPEFTALAEEKRTSYESLYGELDNITYYGMLEQDYEVYSQINCYINTLTNEYYEMKSGLVYLGQDRTEENIEKNGSKWWLDQRPEDFDPNPTTGLEDAPA